MKKVLRKNKTNTNENFTQFAFCMCGYAMGCPCGCVPPDDTTAGMNWVSQAVNDNQQGGPRAENAVYY